MPKSSRPSRSTQAKARALARRRTPLVISKGNELVRRARKAEEERLNRAAARRVQRNYAQTPGASAAYGFLAMPVTVRHNMSQRNANARRNAFLQGYAARIGGNNLIRVPFSYLGTFNSRFLGGPLRKNLFTQLGGYGLIPGGALRTGNNFNWNNARIYLGMKNNTTPNQTKHFMVQIPPNKLYHRHGNSVRRNNRGIAEWLVRN